MTPDSMPPADRGASPRRPDRLRRAFTLVEVLVVLVILSILAGVVTLNLVGQAGRARVTGARLQIRVLDDAVKAYRLDHGAIPTQDQGLEALVRPPTRPPIPRTYPEGGYLDAREIPLDPWGNPYLYFVPGRDGAPYEIVSYGRDGQPGGTGEDAEISSLDPPS